MRCIEWIEYFLSKICDESFSFLKNVALAKCVFEFRPEFNSLDGDLYFRLLKHKQPLPGKIKTQSLNGSLYMFKRHG